MKTVFFGTPDFALTSLKACLDHSELIAVVTQPDRPRGRGQKLSPCPVKARALEEGIPVFSPLSLRKPSEELAAFDELMLRSPPDLFVVTAYGNLLPQRILDLPRLGAINLHASLLPRWRGAAPIQRAVEARDPETGVCLQKMVMELDAGDVLSEAKTEIGENESAISLMERLAALGGTLLETLLRAPRWDGVSQDPSKITHAAKITKEEGLWKSDWEPDVMHARIRAFAAWPQVKARLLPQNLEIKFIETRLFARANTQGPALESGRFQVSEGRVLLHTGFRAGEYVIEVIKIQIPGKAPVRAWDYFQNFPEPPRLESL